MPTIKYTIGIGLAGAIRRDQEYIEQDKWDAMTQEAREAYCGEGLDNFVCNTLDAAYTIEED